MMGSGNESDGVDGSCGSRGRYLRGIGTLVWVGVVILRKDGRNCINEVKWFLRNEWFLCWCEWEA